MFYFIFLILLLQDAGSIYCVKQNRRMLWTTSLSYLRSQVITSKQPKLGLTQELFFSRICESTTGYTFTPCVGSFTFPDIDTRQKRPSAVSVSSERHRQMWGEEIAYVSKQQKVGLNHHPLD